MQKFGNLTSLLKKRQFLCECAMFSFISARFSIEGIRNQSFSVSAFSLKLCFFSLCGVLRSHVSKNCLFVMSSCLFGMFGCIRSLG
jgi:hypothetical protein